MHMSRSGSRRPISDMNLVPFIDVMLVLLVIFMITAPLLTQGVKVELPQTAAKAIIGSKRAFNCHRGCKRKFLSKFI